MYFASGEYIGGAPGGNITSACWAISFWMTMGQTNPWILDKYDGTDGWYFVVQGAGKVAMVHSSSGVLGTIFQSLTSVNTGNETHVLFGYDGSNAYIYLNGTVDNTYVAPTIGNISTALDLDIGSVAGGSSLFVGNLSDVRIYDNMSYGIGDLANLLYETRGNDKISEGLVTRGVLPHGADGSDVTTVPNVGTAGGSFTATSTPQFEAVTLSGF